MIILSQSIALWLCYNRYSRAIFYLWLWISSYFWMRRESTGVKLRNTIHNRLAACIIECLSAFWYTCHNHDTIHNKTPHIPEKVEWLVSYWPNYDRTSKLFIWITRNVPPSKIPRRSKGEIKKIKELIFTLTQWLRNSLWFFNL